MADLMDDYSTADILARTPDGRRMTERERRRLMQMERAGVDLMAGDVRARENDEARRGAVSGPIAEGGLGLMAELTGVPSIMRGAGNIKRGWDEGDLLRGVGGAGEAAMGLIPGAAMTRGGGAALKAAYSSLPRAGVTGAALTLPTAMVDSAEAQQAKAKQNSNWPTTTTRARPQQNEQPAPTADPLAGLVSGNPTLEARYKLLQQKEADSKASIQGVNRASSDAIRQKASEEAAQIRSELLSAIDKASADKKAGDTAEANKNKSVREIYAEYMPYIPVATSILGGVGGGMIKGMYGRAFNAKTANTSESWRKAVEGGDKVGAQAAQAEMQGLMAKGPGGTLPAVGFGATLGLHNSLLPEEIDLARAQPGSKLADDVWKRLTDAQGMTKRLGFGAVAGAAPAFSTAELVGALAKRAPQTYGPETASLASKYTQQGVADVGALNRYKAAEQAGEFGLAEQGIKNQGLLSVADENAQGLISGAQQQRLLADEARRNAADAARLTGGGPQPAGASVAQPAAPSVPQASAPLQPRPQPQPEPAQSQLALPSPKEPREWATIWSDPARAAVQQFVKDNPSMPLSQMKAPQLVEAIRLQLPAGSPLPSVTTARGYLARLRQATGDKPAPGKLTQTFGDDPSRSLFSMAGPAIAGGAGLTGLLGAWPGDRQ